VAQTSWPKKGNRAKQPWEHDDPPITPRAGLPLLSSGSADPYVHTACAQLAALGYETPTSRGENAYGVVGPEELQAFRQFRNDHNVREDPTAFGGDNPVGREIADNHIGPWTLEALTRAYDLEAEEAAA
jgi:peptidoglycan hydrolase-like protein with peptidoglycan-binding domain